MPTMETSNYNVQLTLSSQEGWELPTESRIEEMIKQFFVAHRGPHGERIDCLFVEVSLAEH